MRMTLLMLGLICIMMGQAVAKEEGVHAGPWLVKYQLTGDEGHDINIIPSQANNTTIYNIRINSTKYQIVIGIIPYNERRDVSLDTLRGYAEDWMIQFQKNRYQLSLKDIVQSNNELNRLNAMSVNRTVAISYIVRTDYDVTHPSITTFFLSPQEIVDGEWTPLTAKGMCMVVTMGYDCTSLPYFLQSISITQG